MPVTTAILSLLHEPAARNSATRTFRGQSVLALTLARLGTARRIDHTLIICFDDQRSAVDPIAERAGAAVFSRPRAPIAALDLLTAATRWSDGWRGGLLGACHFDQGFHAATIQAALATQDAGLRSRPELVEGVTQDLLLLLDPSAALVDPALLDAILDHAGRHANYDLFFTQAAPGLGGAVIRPALLDRLAKSNGHPGRLLAYHPDTPGRDPITGDMCVPVPSAVARTLHRFTLDSRRQLDLLDAAITGDARLVTAEELVRAVAEAPAAPAAARDVTLELTPRRAARPIFAAATHLSLDRPDLSARALDDLLADLGGVDDARLTLGGAGDPLLHADFPGIVEKIARSPITAVHVETDLLELSDEALRAIVGGRVDVLSVHLPAATPATYDRVMGTTDGYARVLGNLKRLLAARRGLPIVVPTFTKCRANVDEMEPWYDHWTRVLGAAVITGPSTFGGLIPDTAAADTSPPVRRPCARLGRGRLTIHADGTIPSCEQDVRARQPLGRLGGLKLSAAGTQPLVDLRAAHASGDLSEYPVCLACKEWHRP